MTLKRRIKRLEERRMRSPLVLIFHDPANLQDDESGRREFVKQELQARGLPSDHPVVLISPEEARL